MSVEEVDVKLLIRYRIPGGSNRRTLYDEERKAVVASIHRDSVEHVTAAMVDDFKHTLILLGLEAMDIQPTDGPRRGSRT